MSVSFCIRSHSVGRPAWPGLPGIFWYHHLRKEFESMSFRFNNEVYSVIPAGLPAGPAGPARPAK